jgi:hypothetical protein
MIIGSDPAYYLTFPFSQTQSFTMSSADDDTAPFSNETFPACTQYVNGETVACSNCNLSYYTNATVVFACYDPGQLCSVSSSASSTDAMSRFLIGGYDDDAVNSGDVAVVTTSMLYFG